MQEKQPATCPIITTLCYAIFGPAILKKDNILETVPFSLQPSLSLARITQGSCFLPLTNTTFYLLSNTTDSHLIIVAPHAFYHPDLLNKQTYN